ncbi:MAG: ABC transporter permease [Burkholderiales bacterium]|nr:ABC transporter permease [Burkholderiales bacterium]
MGAPASGMSSRALGLLALPAALFLAVLFFHPLGNLIAFSFSGSGSLANFEKILATPVYLRVLQRTFTMSVATTVLCALIGYPLAWRIATATPRARAILLAIIRVPFWTNLLVRSYGWMIILNPKGAINQALTALGLVEAPLALVYNTTGVLIGMVQIMLPYMVFPVVAVMSRIDGQLVSAARSLGASPVASFVWVYLPMTLPGLMAGALLVFTISLGFFVIPAILGGPRDLMVAQLIEFNVNNTLDWGFAGALSTVLLAATVGVYLVAQRWFGLGSIWGAVAR